MGIILPSFVPEGLGRTLPLIAGLAVCTGCEFSPVPAEFGTHPATHALRASASPVRVRADWNDLDAAVQVAAGQCEMAWLSSTPSEPIKNAAQSITQRRFELVTIEDWPVEVIARHHGSTDQPGLLGPDPVEIELIVRVEAAGPNEGATSSTVQAKARRLENLLRRALVQRLTDLREREWAPLRPISP